jgi:hypothetical protein
MTFSPASRRPAQITAVFLLALAGMAAAGIAFAYISLQPVVEDLQSWMSDRDANLVRMGIDPKLSESEIADALTQKLVDDPGLLDETQSSLDRRSRIYDQVEDRALLSAGCYLLAFKSPEDTAAVLAESGILMAFWPAVVAICLLGAGAIAALVWQPRRSTPAAAQAASPLT